MEKAESPTAKRRKLLKPSEGRVLPKELLLHIFSYLPKPALVRRVGMVCKYWAELSMDSSLWHEVKLVGYRIRRDFGPKLIEGMTQLKRLEATGFGRRGMDEILLAVNPQLEVLILDYVTLHEDPLNHIVTRCRNLKQVSIKNCDTVEDCRHLLDVFSPCPKLESFSLIEVSGTRRLDPSTVRDWQSLKEAHIHTDLPSTDAEVKVITAKVGPQLVKFTARKLMVPRSYTRIGQCSNLEQLHLMINYCMTDSCLQNGLSRLTKLHTLSVWDATYLTSEAMSSFLRRPHILGQLKVLDLSNNPSVDDTCLSAIADSCPLLTHLKLVYCYRITVQGLMEVVMKCSNLKELNVISCSLDDIREGYQRMKALKPRLKVLWD